MDLLYHTFMMKRYDKRNEIFSYSANICLLRDSVYGPHEMGRNLRHCRKEISEGSHCLLIVLAMMA